MWEVKTIVDKQSWDKPRNTRLLISGIVPGERVVRMGLLRRARRKHLIAAIVARLEQLALDDNSAPVQADTAESEALQLINLVGLPTRDFEVLQVAGLLFLARYYHLPDALGQDNLAAALPLLHAVYLEYPDQIPPGLRDYFDEESARPEDEQRMFEFVDDLSVSEGVELYEEFERTGDPDLLRDTVDAFRRSLDVAPPGHPARASRLYLLNAALRTLWSFVGGIDVAREAVQTGWEAVEVSSPDHPKRALRLAGLAHSLEIEFDLTGDANTLREAVDLGREAVQASSPSDPLSSHYLFSLGMASQTLGVLTGSGALLREAVRLSRQAVEATPSGHEAFSLHMGGLGTALRSLYEVTGDAGTLTEAVEFGRQAVEAIPPNDAQGRSAFLSNLGAALHALAVRTGDEDILTDAVRVGREAAEAALPGSSDHASSLSNLAAVLQVQFRLFGADDGDALGEAVRIGREAVDACPSGHTNRAFYLCNHGITLQAQFELTGDSDVLRSAGEAYREAAESPAAPVAAQIIARAGQGRVAMAAGDAPAALTAFEEAVALLPRLVPRELARADREHGIGRTAGLASDAAAAAVQAGRPERAVELLDQARTLLLAEAMDAHGDLSELTSTAPDLAAEFVQLRAAMDTTDRIGSGRASSDVPTVSYSTGADGASGDAEESGTWHAVDRRQKLARDWDDLLARIRRLPALHGFLLAPPIEEIRRTLPDGPVVMVNVSGFRADALILTADPETPVRVVQLPGLTADSVRDQTNRLLAVDATTSTSPRDLLRAQQTVLEILRWLWEEAAAPVLEALGFIGPSEAGEALPRVWWCPVGMMTFLPLHAAGHHDGTGRAVLDHVVSSYTPTIRALRYSLTGRATVGADEKRSTPGTALIVAMPETPEAPALPGAQAEVQSLAGLLPASQFLIGPQATRDTVLAALPQHDIVHLACHGLSDWDTPAASRLLLHDHTTQPLTVASLSELRLPHARLAVLSACSTTASNEALADEAVHITSAFQLAGFHHVVGTMWPISDAISARVAHGLYVELLDSDNASLRPERTAEALHQVTRRLRDEYPRTPTFWAAYIHAGI
ncbi:CHAT domain-containing protein [Streptomyces sp. NPDC002276]